jgi:lysophospholipase L1-like esterase
MNHADLFTKVAVQNFGYSCDFSSKIGMVGSCFSQSIFQKFRRFGFDAWSSPFGTIYNPLSIFNEIHCMIDLQLPLTLNQHGENFFAWETAHTLVSSDENSLEEELFNLRNIHHRLLRETNVLFITVGSAWAYFLQPRSFLVANCHKVPGNRFEKRLLSVEEMAHGFGAMYQALLRFNPNIQVVLTVSPVRHLREGLVQNNRSKARLIEWTHSMVDQYSKAHYFPSYEIIVDELRDYRFFEPDGSHPTPQAVQFVWERLVDVMVSKESQSVFSAIEEVRKMEEHRRINQSDKKASMAMIDTKKKALETYDITW